MKKQILVFVTLAMIGKASYAKWVWSPVTAASYVAGVTWTPVSYIGTPIFAGRSGTYVKSPMTVHSDAYVQCQYVDQSGSVTATAHVGQFRRFYWVSPKNVCSLCPTPPTPVSLNKSGIASWKLEAAGYGGPGVGGPWGGIGSQTDFTGTATLNATSDYAPTSNTGTTSWGGGHPAGPSLSQSATANVDGSRYTNADLSVIALNVSANIKCTVVYQVDYTTQVVATAYDTRDIPTPAPYYPTANGVAGISGDGL